MILKHKDGDIFQRMRDDKTLGEEIVFERDDTGKVVRMWQHSDFYTGAHGVRFDVALNANIRERLRIARVNGS